LSTICEPPRTAQRCIHKELVKGVLFEAKEPVGHGQGLIAEPSPQEAEQKINERNIIGLAVAILPMNQVNRLEITPDKQLLAAAGNPHIRLFEVNSNNPQPYRSFNTHTNNVTAVGFQCDGKWMYSGSEDGTVKIWDLRAPGCQREYESRAAVNTVVLHPNQTELISGDQNGNIRVWDLTANSCSCELVPEVDTAVRSLTVMWDGSLVVAANNHGTCYVWRLLRGTQTMTNFEPLHKLQAHNTYILKCLLSPEFCEHHRYLATTSSDRTVKIWNVDGFTLERTLTGHQRWVWDCVFSVDGAFLVT
ncbi:hypothetical protein KI387_029414, partial [Taxus chinensis]